MKLNGQSFNGPNVALVVILRNGEPIAFKAQAVLDYTKFDALCPRPKAKQIVKRGGETEVLTNDPNFLKALEHYGKTKTAYVIVQSLKATESLEFEQVKDDDPTSWLLWREEFENAHFSEYEIGKILSAVWEANGMDEEKLEEARKRFLAGQEAERENATSLLTVPKNMQSGEPAKGSE